MRPGLSRDWTETNELNRAHRSLGGYVNAANDMMARGEYDLALRSYTRAIAEEGLSGAVIGGIGAASLQLDRHGQALKMLERGTRIQPQSVPVWNNLGVALAEVEEGRAAGEAFRLARSLQSKSDPAVSANLERLLGGKVAAAATPEHPLVRHRSGYYLMLERGENKEAENDEAT